MATIIDHILTGETHKATTLIETLLKQKTLEFINEAKAEVAEGVYGGLEEGEYDDGFSEDESMFSAKTLRSFGMGKKNIPRLQSTDQAIKKEVAAKRAKEQVKEEYLTEAKMIQCNKKTFPGCGCGGYHKESSQAEYKKERAAGRTGFKGLARYLPPKDKSMRFRGGFSNDEPEVKEEFDSVSEEYLTEISQAIPWPARSKHIHQYTKPKGDTGSTYIHPEGHKIEFHKDAEGNSGWTHTTKEGKSKSGKNMGDLHLHLMKTHGNYDDRVKKHLATLHAGGFGAQSHMDHAMGALSYKHHKKGEGDPEDNALEYKAMHSAMMKATKRDRGVK